MHTPSRHSSILWSSGASDTNTPAGSPHSHRRSIFNPPTFASPAPSTPASTLSQHPIHTPAGSPRSRRRSLFDPPHAPTPASTPQHRIRTTTFTFTSSTPSSSSSALWTANTCTTPSRQYKPTEPLGPTTLTPPRASSSTAAYTYTPTYGVGYLAFPPSGPSSEAQVFPEVTEDANAEAERRQQAQEREREEEEQARTREEAAEREAQAEKAREEAEAEARRGEEAWVRSGGMLRDARGMRDVARTEAVRAELKLREWEEGVTVRWEGYEKGWRRLLGGGAEEGGRGEVRFGDIPWPVVGMGDKRGVELGDLTAGRVEEFLLEGLRVRGCKVTRKERVRSSLLRWHPDKMTGVLARVVEEDAERVTEGIRVVTECLQALNART